MATDRAQPRPRLPRGANALPPSDRDRVHRQRIQDALVVLVAEQGFADTSIRDVCTRSQVAARDLYVLYPGKQELLLATCDALVRETCDAVASARRAASPADDIAQTVATVLDPIAQAIVTRPAHANLVLVDVFSAGAAGPPYRRELVTRLRRLLADALSGRPGADGLSEASLTVVAAGTLQLFEHRVRTGKARTLPKLVPQLAAWAASYRTASPLPLPIQPAAAPVPDAPTSDGGLPRDARNLPRQFVVPHQRERIMRAVVELSVDEGYAGIGIPAIAGQAQISNRTFYQHFPSKHDAFVAVYDHAFGKLFARTWAAASRQTSWTSAVHEGVRAWAGYVATEPGLARFGFSDVLTVGREAVEKVDDAYRAFADLFGRGRPGDPEIPDAIAYAIAGGVAGLVASWVTAGHAQNVQQLIPHMTYAVLAPSIGDSEALHVSGLSPTPVAVPVPPPANDGARAMVAFARIVAEQGYEQATLVAAAERAGVDPSVVAEFFDDEADCALQALDAWTDRTFAAMAAAFASAPRDGALAVHRALGAMLAQMVSEPDMLELSVRALDQLGPEVVALRTRYVTVFIDVLLPSITPEGPAPGISPVASQIIAEGVFAVLRTHVEEHRISELPAALPEISLLCIAPFFGQRRAFDVAQLPFAVTH
jgi:AcrR family transcriptional regulator